MRDPRALRPRLFFSYGSDALTFPILLGRLVWCPDVPARGDFALLRDKRHRLFRLPHALRRHARASGSPATWAACALRLCREGSLRRSSTLERASASISSTPGSGDAHISFRPPGSARPGSSGVPVPVPVRVVDDLVPPTSPTGCLTLLRRRERARSYHDLPDDRAYAFALDGCERRQYLANPTALLARRPQRRPDEVTVSSLAPRCRGSLAAHTRCRPRFADTDAEGL